MLNFEELSHKLFSLVIFRNLLNDDVIKSFTELADEQKSEKEEVYLYADFLSKLFAETDNFSKYVLNAVLEDENAYILNYGHKKLGSHYDEALNMELDTLNELAAVRSDDVKKSLHLENESLPGWTTEKADIKSIYLSRIKNISKTGYGIWAKYHVFIIKNGDIVPVKYPDTQKLSDFSGYERERSEVIDNTKALLKGEPCNNVLLYGDAGSGKSSTVKAIANEFKDDGLRLIEVKKNQLYSLPDIMDRISGNPLKFIIFIDDLSFTKNDEDFGALKAILEGSVNGRAKNIAIYATSNRRHLVKESFADRDGDDVHIQDTMQELTSLSARFGLQITFSRPDKNLYSGIVVELAKKYGIDMPEDKLIMKAEAHALRAGGRSPRTARQFIEYLAYKQDTEKE